MASSNTNDNKKENNGDNLPLGRDPFEAANGDNAPTPPSADGRDYLIDGEIRRWEGKCADVFSPIYRNGDRVVMGQYGMLTEKEAVEAVNAAAKAWDHGRGAWAKSSTRERISAVERYLEGLKSKRDEIVSLIMWEICKTAADAAKEVDRTIQYIEQTITELKRMENDVSGVAAMIRRAPLGVVLCCGPFNYPFNETYTVLIPALIMGNSVVMKLPRVGVLCHAPTLSLFKEFFPAGVVNVISGSGRATMPYIMSSGLLDVFAFIGTSSAADDLQKAHPKPHRLRICLGLEAKNLAVVTPSCDLDLAVEEVILGSLSYNGQRCTAIKIVLVHESLREEFNRRLVAGIDALTMGMPWEKGVKITPLPEEGKPGYLEELINDATAKGASIINQRGGKRDRTFVSPTVLYPVNSKMRIWNEEQFGPVVPVASYSTHNDVFDYMAHSPYGQQAAIFSTDAQEVGALVDVMVNMVSRVNINGQCQRGPDQFPFTARKDSAYGTLSVHDALRVFSLRSLVALKQTEANEGLVNRVLSNNSSKFLRIDYMF